jgi:hypothetical protein
MTSARYNCRGVGGLWKKLCKFSLVVLEFSVRDLSFQSRVVEGIPVVLVEAVLFAETAVSRLPAERRGPTTNPVTQRDISQDHLYPSI